MNAAELEQKAERALHFLYEKAGDHAVIRAQADHIDDWLKVELASIKGRIIGMSDAAATAEAMRHPDYLKALEAVKTAKTLWYEAQFKRETANAFIQAWQTASANERRGMS